ncbi:MAG: hypothetical protein EPO09_09695 [Aquabacterium sp.]|uniref:hypothetical protein n=1 Tax=Aquabacterium sp. TaxID=1872578 RepID=UPI0012293C72|nr:hypothetical protein [Aquabacterium sp.]TAK94424.1 MAG: hypothetical protein EPO09_09695 [Aquabacterium sp.]
MTFKAMGIASLAMLSSLTFAAPTTYTFTTGTGSAMAYSEVANLLGTTATVSGQFTYDPQASQFGNALELGFGESAVIYLGTPPALAFSGLSGSVGGHSFSDPYGTVAIGNDRPESSGVQDVIHITADPTPKVGSNTTPSNYPRQLSTFEIGDYRLDNVRFFWLQGADGADDFLTSTDLPAQLPAHAGVLALDFVRISDPGNLANTPYYNNSVFFGNLLVQPMSVPEPHQVWLSLLGMSLMALKIRRDRSA